VNGQTAFPDGTRRNFRKESTRGEGKRQQNDSWSMKIVRDGFGFGDEQGLDAFGFDGDDVVLILQDAFNGEEFLAGQQQAIAVEQVGRGRTRSGESATWGSEGYWTSL
jgi:hypothetical protein